MTKYIYGLFAVLFMAATITSCAEEEGTEPGNDGSPVITVYQYTVALPYNSDNDVALRIATNNRVTAVYYLAEPTADQQSRLESLGEDGYAQYVVENGTQVDGISGNTTTDVVLTGLTGAYIITVVGTDGSSLSSRSVEFTGLAWEDVVAGTYVFGTSAVSGTPAADITGEASRSTVLQVCTTDATLYRFCDVFGEGYSMKINLLDQTGSDADGDYQFFRVPAVTTPYTFGSYGEVTIEDIGYWQGDASFVTDGGYESGMYADHTCFILVAYLCSAGTIGYGYDYFLPEM